MRAAPQHFLSFSRVLLGGVVLGELVDVYSSRLVLPAVIAACLADYADGTMARARGTAGEAGRLIDNLCDAAFLGLAFSGFALAKTWSLPLVGYATRVWEQANWTPAIALAGSFGTYVARWAWSSVRRERLAPSPSGHTAGVANYLLALLGGVMEFLIPRKHLIAVDPGWNRWDLEVYRGIWSKARLSVAAENHGGSKRLLNVRCEVRLTRVSQLAVTIFALAAALGLLFQIPEMIGVGVGVGLVNLAVIVAENVRLGRILNDTLDIVAGQIGLRPLGAKAAAPPARAT